MIQLELDRHEAAMLQEILSNDLFELVSEIAHTDAKDYRDRLRRKQSLMRRLVAELERAPGMESSLGNA